jgi:hypothetical protein
MKLVAMYISHNKVYNLFGDYHVITIYVIVYGTFLSTLCPCTLHKLIEIPEIYLSIHL